MWQCKKCKREFAKVNQAHSCVSYPLTKHFKNKEIAKELFDYYIDQVNQKVGKTKIESLPCCIHLVSTYTFSAVWAMKDKIRVDFRAMRPIKNLKYWRMSQISKNRFMYYIDIYKKEEITDNLLAAVKESYRYHD